MKLKKKKNRIVFGESQGRLFWPPTLSKKVKKKHSIYKHKNQSPFTHNKGIKQSVAIT